MKKLILAASILFCTAATMTSCNNGDYDANPSTNNSGVANPIPPDGGGGGNGGSDCPAVNKTPISATVNGEEFVGDASNFFTRAEIENNPITGKNIFEIQAYKASFQGEQTSIFIAIDDYTGPKSYSIGAGSTVGGIGPAANPSMQYTTPNGGGGQIVITREDADTVAGTFYVTARNSSGQSKTACGGYFKMKVYK